MPARLRVYYNKANDPAGIWSVDQGTTATELKFDSIVSYVAMWSGYNPSAVMPEPKAWLECEGVLHIDDRQARISND